MLSLESPSASTAFEFLMQQWPRISAEISTADGGLIPCLHSFNSSVKDRLSSHYGPGTNICTADTIQAHGPSPHRVYGLERKEDMWTSNLHISGYELGCCLWIMSYGSAEVGMLLLGPEEWIWFPKEGPRIAKPGKEGSAKRDRMGINLSNHGRMGQCGWSLLSLREDDGIWLEI